MTINALAGLSPDGPKFDLVGPTVDDDIRRIIARYGTEAVKQAVKRVTKPKRGRKPEKDWPELREVIESDARDWLAGGDPFSSRSNYSIAKDFADKNPGHSHPATMKRIERKLVQKRVWMTLVTHHRALRLDRGPGCIGQWDGARLVVLRPVPWEGENRATTDRPVRQENRLKVDVLVARVQRLRQSATYVKENT